MLRRRLPTREESIRRHARLRALQRFGLALTEKREAELVRQIREGRAEFVDRQSRRLTRWRVTFDGLPAIAVLDSRRGMIVTLLRPGDEV